MRFPIFRTAGLLFYSSLLYASPAFSQSAVLMGKVSDAADNSPIPGADIVVRNSGNTVGTTTSLADGKYLVKGLKKGDQVDAYYSRGGYRPNPMPSTVVLSDSENTQDIQLIRDTAEALYWRSIATKVKTGVESTTPDQAAQVQLYDRTWSTLALIGLPPDAQAEAARQLSSVAPLATGSHDLMGFATVDDKDLHWAEVNIRAAVHGKATLTRRYSLPSAVAVNIAANEWQQHPPDISAQTKFSKDFEAVWGPEAAIELQSKLDRPCPSFTASRLSPQCLGPDDVRSFENILKFKPQ